MKIRAAQPADIVHILRHRLAMFEEMGHTNAAVLDELQRVSEAYLGPALRDGSYRGWLAETDQGRVVAGGGLVIASWPGFPGEATARRAWILNVYTDRDFRRRGIAKRITQEIIEWCRAEGFSSVSLHASDDGRALYETLGFQPTNEMRLKLR